MGGVFGIAFFGIGLTVLGFLWLSPFGAWDSPPLFFRIFGSFIAICFVAMGGTVAMSAILGGGLMRPSIPAVERVQPHGIAAAGPLGGYHCPQCAAPLSDKADVSPLGDVKSTFCGAWFNIHQSKS